jgi:hypothetical protein
MKATALVPRMARVMPITALDTTHNTTATFMTRPATIRRWGRTSRIATPFAERICRVTTRASTVDRIDDDRWSPTSHRVMDERDHRADYLAFEPYPRLDVQSRCGYRPPLREVMVAALQAKLSQSFVVVGTASERPVIKTVRFLDGQIVDAGIAVMHDALIVKLPVLIPVGTEPVS